MNATITLLVALPFVGAAIGAAGLWLSKHYMPARRIPAAKQDQVKYTVSPAPTMKAFSKKSIAVRLG